MNDKIAEIKARRAAITSTPSGTHWCWQQEQINGERVDGYYEGLYAENAEHTAGIGVINASCGYFDDEPDPTPIQIEPKDAAFIAAAPADIDYLLTEVERLTAANARLRAWPSAGYPPALQASFWCGHCRSYTMHDWDEGFIKCSQCGQ